MDLEIRRISSSSLCCLLVRTEYSTGVFTLSYLEESGAPEVVITSSAAWTKGPTALTSLQNVFQNVVRSCLVPHEKFSFRIEVLITRDAGIFSVLDLVSSGVSASLLLGRAPLVDTPISYVERFSKGAIWISKSHFLNRIVGAYVVGEIDQKEVEKSAEKIGNREIERLRRAVEGVLEK